MSKTTTAPAERDLQVATDLLPFVQARLHGLRHALECCNCEERHTRFTSDPQECATLLYRQGWRVGHFWGGVKGAVCPRCAPLYTLPTGPARESE